MNNLIFFPSRIGQQVKGVDKTAKTLYNLLDGHNKQMIKCKRLINNDFYKLYNANLKISEPKINIGGDHSMSVATVASSLMMYNNLKVIWIDAHADINTRNSSKTKNFHGMPLAFLTKLDKRKFLFNWPKLQFKNILYIGIRDLDPFEKDIIKKHNIKTIKTSNINSNPEKCWKTIDKFIDNDPVHLSFDVDSLDPTIIPCTGTPVCNGLRLKPTKKILTKLRDKNIVNMDIVELNLKLGNKDDEFKSISNYVNLFEDYLKWKN
jgi:arginase